jgi:hypothetical protein
VLERVDSHAARACEVGMGTVGPGEPVPEWRSRRGGGVVRDQRQVELHRYLLMEGAGGADALPGAVPGRALFANGAGTGPQGDPSHLWPRLARSRQEAMAPPLLSVDRPGPRGREREPVYPYTT